MPMAWLILYLFLSFYLSISGTAFPFKFHSFRDLNPDINEAGFKAMMEKLVAEVRSSEKEEDVEVKVFTRSDVTELSKAFPFRTEIGESLLTMTSTDGKASPTEDVTNLISDFISQGNIDNLTRPDVSTCFIF